VQRHRVTRRLRHVARGLLDEMDRTEDLVVRALPSSRNAASSTLEVQLRAGLRRAHKLMGAFPGARP
jgi:ribonuclease P protein component